MSWRVPAGVRTVLLAVALVAPALFLVLPGFGPTVLVPALIELLPLMALRRWPLAVLAALLYWLVLVRQVPMHGTMDNIRDLQTVVIDLVLGYVAATLRPRISISAALVALTVQLAMAAVFPLWPGYLRAYGVLDIAAVIIVWLVGNTIRTRRQYRLSRRAQAEAAIVQAERLRIARELHDMVAHSIGVIAVQAGMGSRVIDTQPAEAGAALGAIESASRDTLAGLRRMIGVLRRSDGEPIDPQHGLRDLDDLVARSRDAGVRVDVRWRGERRPLPPDIDLSAFRIIQEAVTNVVRHAGTDRCEVTVDHGDQELFIDVTDNGRGGVPEPGYGLRGMRERVTLLRGEFTAAPRPEGGFRVTARIPLPEGVR